MPLGADGRRSRGPDDEVGTLNFITPEMVVEASRLVRRGTVFSLAIDFGPSGPQNGQHSGWRPRQSQLPASRSLQASFHDAPCRRRKHSIRLLAAHPGSQPSGRILGQRPGNARQKAQEHGSSGGGRGHPRKW